ncbi:hypothetical protein Tco_0898950 [Tanacetum coccineum]
MDDLEREIRADKHTIERILKEKDKTESDFFKSENEKVIIQHETQLAKKAFEARENSYLEDIVDLEEKLSSHDRIVYKMGQLVQTIHMLGKRPNKVYDPFLQAGLGYQNTERLKKAIAAQPKMYEGERLHIIKLIIDSPNSEETLEDAEESRLKMKNKMIQLNYAELNALYETFVPQKEFSADYVLTIVLEDSQQVESTANPFIAPTTIRVIEPFMQKVGYQGVVDKLFHVVVDHTHIDYAALLWWDFLNYVQNKKDVIQYPRFIKLIITDLMKKFPSIPQLILIPDAFVTDEISATDDYAEYETVIVKIREVLDHCKNVVLELTFAKTNEILKEEVPRLVNLAVNRDREIAPTNVPELISKEFATYVHEIIVELFQKHMQNTTVNLYPTTSSLTATTLTMDIQHQFYLTMKSNNQDQTADPELWDILKAKYKKP